MAFYKEINKQDRQQKRQSAEQRGGFEDEGARYGKGRGAAKTPRAEGATNAPAAGAARQAADNRQGGRNRRDNPGKPGAVRFVKGAPQTYSERGAGTKPLSYDDRRQAQRGNDAPRYGRDDQRPQGNFARPAGRDDQPRYARPAGRDDRPQGSYGRPAPRDDQPRNARPAPRDDRPQGSSGRPAQPTRPPRRDEATRAPRRDDAPRPRRVPDEFAPASKDFNSFRYQQQAKPAPVPVAPIEEDMAPENLLCGRNPIREALKSGRDIEKLLVQKGELTGSAREIIQLAKELRVPVQEVEKVHLDSLARSHQGMVAYASAYQYHTVEDMLDLAKQRGEDPFLVILDGITDPHNLGAIIRTAECAGAHGVIVSERRAVGLTPAAVKASAGAVEHLPVARVVNLSQTLEELKALGVWSFAADMEGEDYRSVDFSGPVALIIGAEGEGVSRLLLSKCDHRVSLPLKGEIDSLNASVAAGVLLYHILETR